MTERGATSRLVAANKALVRRWFELLAAGDVEGASQLTDPDGTMWSPRQRLESPLDEWHVQFAILRAERFPDGIHFDLGLMTGEDDRLAVMVEGGGRMSNGRVYDNRYLWYFEADGERIHRVREYNDTHHAHLMFVGPDA